MAPLGLGRAEGRLPRICRRQASHLRRPQGPAGSPSKRPGGPGRSLCGRWVVQPSFVFFFIVAAALHWETEHGASFWKMVSIYIGFQEIYMVFFRASEVFRACPSPAGRAAHTGSSQASMPAARSPRSPATACSKLCIGKLVEELMPR